MINVINTNISAEDVINKIIMRAINKGFVKDSSEVKVEHLNNGNAWVSVPRKYHKGMIGFTVMKDHNGNYDSVIGRFGTKE